MPPPLNKPAGADPPQTTIEQKPVHRYPPKTDDMETSTAIIETRNLSKRVPSPEGPLDILSNISLRIEYGESVAVIGASGSGKSTLLGLLAGLDVPTSGNVTLGGRNLNDLDEDGRAALRAKWVGFVFQGFQLLNGLTAVENVMLPLELAGNENPRDDALEILHRVGLTPRSRHYPLQLSGGEQQRVAIARAFAARPRILFADEPTGNLDTRTGERIQSLLFDLNEEVTTTLILVTHDQALASNCDRALMLDVGRLTPSQDLA